MFTDGISATGNRKQPCVTFMINWTYRTWRSLNLTVTHIVKLLHQACVCVKYVRGADLFVELPPVAHKWPASLPRNCRQLWPLYMSAGISLCAIPGGKLQLPVLPEREREKKKALNSPTQNLQ